MDTNNLIEKLTKDLKPVRALPAPAFRAMGASFIGIIAVIVAVRAFHGPRIDVQAAMQNTDFIVGDLLMLVGGLLAAFAAATLVVPDTRLRYSVSVPLGLSTFIWLALSLHAMLHLTMNDMQAALHENNSCTQGLIFLSLVPIGLSLILALRGAPVWRGLAGYALTLSMTSFAGIGMRFLCPGDAPAHLLVWHFLPVLGLSVVGIALGRIALQRR